MQHSDQDLEVDSNAASTPEQRIEFAGLSPRFSLRMLLFLPVVLGGSIVLFQWFGAIGGAAYLLVLLIVFLHVAGNAIGTQLRDNADRAGGREAAERGWKIKPPTREHFAPRTKLSQKSSLGMPLLIATILGVIVGAIAGYFLLHGVYSNRLPVLVILIGLFSTGALGGFWGYWSWSLLQVLFTAWWEAHSCSAKEAQQAKQRRLH